MSNKINIQQESLLRDIDYIRTGAELLAAALRDPAPIINLETFWRFMRVIAMVEDCLTEPEKKTSQNYQQYMSYIGYIKQLEDDVMFVKDDGLMYLGDQLVEVMAAYAEQSTTIVTFLLEQRQRTQMAPLMEEFEPVMYGIMREVEEVVPYSEAVGCALAAFQQCQLS